MIIDGVVRMKVNVSPSGSWQWSCRSIILYEFAIFTISAPRDFTRPQSSVKNGIQSVYSRQSIVRSPWGILAHDYRSGNENFTVSLSRNLLSVFILQIGPGQIRIVITGKDKEEILRVAVDISVDFHRVQLITLKFTVNITLCLRKMMCSKHRKRKKAARYLRFWELVRICATAHATRGSP